MIYKIIIFIFCLFAVFGDFLANEKPIYCKNNNSHYFPIFRGYLIDLGWSEPYDEFSGVRWSEIEYEDIIWPPIPYSYHTIDRKNMNYRSPIGNQQIESTRFRHWLGTDAIGRDVFAGIIHGTRIAFSVGLIAMAIALALGIILGSLSGYFGNDSISLKNYHWMGLLIGIIPSFFISFFGRTAQLWLEGGFFNWTLSIMIFLILMFFFFKALYFLKILPFFNKHSFVPVDGFIMRLIEIVDSIPTLLLLLSALAILEKPSLFWVMAIIGLLNWTGIARLLRGEILKIKKMAFIDTAKILGFGHWHILVKEILPNALQPVIVSVSFGMAGAILLEAFLSFLGIGGNPQMVTWGSMLNGARNYFPAWWLALFPGLFIFLTVFSFNRLGEIWNEKNDPER
jgi:peptide/nickel transport system permease protein